MDAAITVTVSWTDDGGAAESLTSMPTAAVTDVNDAPTGSVTITGTATQGQTLTADTSGIADEDGLGTFAYQWKRDGTDIEGATGETYVLAQADVGAAITVTVTWTDTGNTVESLTSAATAAVTNVNDAPTGSVTITGTATQDETLTAVTTTVADPDGPDTLEFSYQWKRDGTAIVSATASTYALVQADVGAAITVTVSWTDGGNTVESLTSAATDAVTNANDAPTGAVTITGTATQGQTLTAVTTTIADPDGPETLTFSYQWKRDGTDISGATAATYTLAQADVGAAIAVTVSWTDDGNTEESLTSEPTTAVANINDAPTGSVTISGTATQGETLTADISGIADADGLGTFLYQWKRDGTDIASATGATYVLAQADVGAAITVTVSWTDGGNTVESLTSTATAEVTDINDAPTGAVTITGTATQGQTLTAGTSGIADADGLGTFSYQWKRDGTDIASATGATYVLAQADVGAAITVTVSWTDGGNTVESLTSDATAAVANVNDTPTGSVTITGTATQGQTLTADTSDIADPDGLGTFSYQWKRDGADITAATGATYVLTQADVGAEIAVTVSWTDGGNTVESLTSTATAAVTNANDAPTGAVAIGGTATQGQTLTAVTTTISDPDGPATLTLSYQWKRDGTNIEGATGETYVLTQADVGAAITVTVSWTDGGNTAESLTSAATAAVANVNDAPTGAVTIGGTATQGQTLTAVTSGIADPDGPATLTFSYQWHRDGEDITGATGATYVLVQADVGAAITVTVSWTDDGGAAESLTSAPTAAVTGVNNAPMGSVTITGTATQGQTLTADTSGISDPDGPQTLMLAYQWKRDGVDIPNATAATHVLTQADVGAAITVTVSWTDAGNTVESLTSTATDAVANVNDAPTGSVTIGGTATQGQTLTAVTNTIADPDGPATLTFSYRWKRDGVDIPGVPGATYVLAQADVGAAITVTVSWTDAGNTVESLTSAPTAAVTDVNDAPTGSVTIGGTATQGETLTAVTDTISDPDGPATLTFSYQWKRADTAIPGATGATYVLAQADVGARITVTVSWTDAGDTAESLTSAPTDAVADAAITVTGADPGTVLVSGDNITAEVDGTAVELTLPSGHGVGGVTFDHHAPAPAVASPGGVTFGFDPVYVAIELDANLPADASAVVCLPKPHGVDEPAVYHRHDDAAEWTALDEPASSPDGFVCGETELFSTFVVGGPASSDATLNAIVLTDAARNDIALNEPFDSAMTAYTADVTHDVAGIAVTATPAHPAARYAVSVDGTAYDAGVAPLATGETAIAISVTAEDMTTKRTYSVTVTRAAADLVPTFEGESVPDRMWTVGEEIEALTLPAASGGDGPLRYTLEPDVSAYGLVFDPAERAVAGTPDAALSKKRFIYTATDSDPVGADSVSLAFYVTIADDLEERGRTVAETVAATVEDRAVASRQAPEGSVQGTIAGQAVALHSLGDDLGRLFEGLAEEDGSMRSLEADEVLSGTSFQFSPLGSEGAWTLWGRGSASRFEGRPERGFSMEGEVLSGYLGFDTRLGADLLAGVAASRSEGAMSYRFAGGTEGEMDTVLTGVHPYAHWSPRAGLGLWATLGYGAGEATLDDGVEGPATTDLAMRMAAAGARKELAPAHGVDWALKADAFLVRLDTEELDNLLPAVSAESHRLRVAAEGSAEAAFDGGSRLRGTVELGARLDGGDADEGAGVETGGRVAWTDPRLGLDVEARGRFLLAHGAEGFDEWGASLSARFDPGAPGVGFHASLAPALGEMSGGADAVAAEGEEGGTKARRDPAMRLEAEAGYGLGLAGEDVLLTPFGGLNLSDRDRRERLGARLGIAAPHGLDMAFALYGEREHRDDGAGGSALVFDSVARRGFAAGRGALDFSGGLRTGDEADYRIGLKLRLRF